MPNPSEGQGANLSGRADQAGPQRPTNREDERSLLSSLTRDAARVRRASSAELQLPWTCPVTHSREKFYTVCSDYALLNQAASVYCPLSTPREVAPSKQDEGASFVKPKISTDLTQGQLGGTDVASDGDCDMEEVSAGNTKPILAWEIDTTDFNAVLTRKIITSGAGSGQTENQGKALAHMTSVESDSSDSSGLWSPIDTATSPNFSSANSFSAFGPNNSFNLTGVFSGMSFPKTSESQQSWPEFNTVSSSIWDVPCSDSLHSWPSSSGSPTAPTTSILGNTRNPWSTTTPFGSSIWSTSGDSALHSFAPSINSTTLTDLVSHPAPPAPAPTEMTYNPWNMWRPTLSRRSSEPWPNPSDNSK